MRDSVSVADYKKLSRFMWGAGDYDAVARLVQVGADRLVEDLEIGPGMHVLDIATGTGNAAIPAALAGAHVVGGDITLEHFHVARSRAGKAGVHVEWREADAEALPFPDACFDRVMSTYGIQFAPRHDMVASELARVCRPGGLIGLCNWTPQGWTGRFTDIVAGYFSSPPNFAQPAMMWGVEQYVQRLFALHVTDWRMTRATIDYVFTTVDEFVSFFEANFGPWILARQAISPPHRWEELRAALREMTLTFNVSAKNNIVVPAEYLMAIGRRSQ